MNVRVDALEADEAISTEMRPFCTCQRFGPPAPGRRRCTTWRSWRVKLASEGLHKGGQGIAALSAELGYQSEAAFNRAFKLHTGRMPGAVARDAAQLSAAMVRGGA